MEKQKQLQNPENKKIPCEIYSRVVGYFRPVNQMNPGKRAEFGERKYYDPEEINYEVK
jgi:anaerobic ribonucleoside-triphosphate reductase